VTGIALDGADQPVAGAQVHLSGLGRSYTAVSDESGRFAVDVQPGTYLVIASSRAGDARSDGFELSFDRGEQLLGVAVELRTRVEEEDGVPDAVDRCPDEPEDQDGLEDVDGCPDVSEKRLELILE
jgi:hypothetical protein